MALCSKGRVVNTIAAVAVAKALIEKSSDESLEVLDLDNSSWAKSIFVRMGFVKKASTTARPEIPEGARKEAELIFHHEITSLVERYSFPPTIHTNMDQTPLKYAPVSSRTIPSMFTWLVSPTNKLLLALLAARYLINSYQCS